MDDHDAQFSNWDEFGLSLAPEMDVAKDVVAFLRQYETGGAGAEFPVSDALALVFRSVIALDVKIVTLRAELNGGA